MASSPPSVGDVRRHAAALSAMAAALLTGLASGKYDNQVAFDEKVLSAIGLVFPPAAAVEESVKVFLFINKMTAPRTSLVLSEDGISWVPESNSRYNPKTGDFL